jgi:hypothetical protein
LALLAGLLLSLRLQPQVVQFQLRAELAQVWSGQCPHHRQRAVAAGAARVTPQMEALVALVAIMVLAVAAVALVTQQAALLVVLVALEAMALS